MPNDEEIKVFVGHYPAMPIVAIPPDHPAPLAIGWVTWLLSFAPDITLTGATMWIYAGHTLGWFLLSPWPVRIGAAFGAILGPAVLVVRFRESYYRGNLNKKLYEEAEQRTIT